MKKIHSILFLTFLILVLGTTNSPILSFIAESKESIEEEESCAGNHAEDEKIKQTGAGGSGLEEQINPIFQKIIIQAPRISLLLSVSFIKSFSLKIYHNYLLNTLYFPKLYILFHCTKAFLS